MKTITQVKKDNADYASLIQAVVIRIGEDWADDYLYSGDAATEAYNLVRVLL